MKFKLKTYWIAIISLLFSACSESIDRETFDKINMLEGYSNIISGTFLSFNDEADTLVLAIQEFDTESNITTLNAAQDQLLSTLLALQSSKPFNIDVIKNGLYIPKLAQWPVLIPEIENTINGENEIDSSLLGSLGANLKGIYAMEYLLFDNQKTDVEIVSMFTSATNNEKRRAYLLELAKEVKRLGMEMLDEWNNYQPIFLTRTENSVSGSENRIYNESVSFIDEVLNRVKIPYEAYKNESIEPNATNLIAWNSSFTKELLVHSIEILNITFENGVNNGFDDHLDFVNAQWEDGIKVSNAINEEYGKCKDILEQITNLEFAILNDNPLIDELLISIKSILQLYRSDMTSWLSLILLVSDNDGD